MEREVKTVAYPSPRPEKGAEVRLDGYLIGHGNPWPSKSKRV